MNANLNYLNEIQNIRMQILTNRKEFDTFEFKFEPLKPNSKHSNGNSNFSKGIQSILMQKWNPLNGIRTIQMHIESDSHHLSSNFNYQVEQDSKRLNANSSYSKGIRSIWMQILTIWKKPEAFECKFEPFQPNSKHSNAKWTLGTRFNAFECIF